MEKVAKKVGMEHFKTKINVNNMKPHTQSWIVVINSATIVDDHDSESRLNFDTNNNLLS